MRGSSWHTAVGREPRYDDGPAPRVVVPTSGQDAEDSIAAFQRLAGNEATRLVVQRFDDEDAESLSEAAKFVANPIAYVGSKAGEWGAEKIKELTGANDHGVAGGEDHVAAGGDDHVAAGGDDHLVGGGDHVIGGGGDHVIGGGEDHVVGGSKATAGGARGGARPEEPVGGDPLVGLRPGDGLDVGTWQRRPRVKLLQYRLNEAAGVGIKVDGMWGKRTTAALEALQLARGIVPVPTVDAATSAALAHTPKGGAEIPGDAGGSSRALPDISGRVAPDVLARWQAPLVIPPGSAVPAGPGSVPTGPGSGGSGGTSLVGMASSLVGPAGPGGGATTGRGGNGAFASSMGIRTDPETLARFEQYKPVLYDMWYRYDRASRDTQAYFALVGQSAAAAAYWASRAVSSICASLAGIVLGPPGVALWTVANQFWGLGARAAEEAERPILEAATGPALDAIIAFGNVVQQSFDMAYPMRTPDMPWYVVGSGWIGGPTASLINAYGQVQRLSRS